jgi:hypothetical protein
MFLSAVNKGLSEKGILLIIILKYIAGKICFPKPINLLTSEGIDIEMNYILMKANSLLNSNTTNVLIRCK